VIKYKFYLLFFISLTLFACSAQGVYHQVRSGQTLYAISKAYKADVDYIARVNGLSDPSQLKTGQKLFIPGATELQYVPLTKSSPGTVHKNTPVKPHPVQAKPKKIRKSPAKPRKAVAIKKKKAAPPVKRVILPAPPVKRKFSWPARGKLLKKFGTKKGHTGKGIEISIKRNTPVLAAAAGRVVYSGNGLSGYGNLIVIEHDNNYVTIYGFNSKNLIKTESFVSRGQAIALSGQAPSSNIPALYFEIRYGKKMIDPILYLP